MPGDRVSRVVRWSALEPEDGGEGYGHDARPAVVSPAGVMISNMRANFRIGEVFDAENPSAGYVVRLSMALNDMLTMFGFIRREDVSGGERQLCLRVLVAQIREAVWLVSPPKATVLITLDDYLKPFEDDHPDDVAGARAAAQELRSVLECPWMDGGTVEQELRRIRDGVYHFSRDAGGNRQLVAAMRLAARETGSLTVDENGRRARYADKVARQMAFPGVSDAEAVQRFDAIMDSIGECVELVRMVVERIEGFWITTRSPGVVSMTYPDGRFEPHDGRGLIGSKRRARP